MPSASWKRQKVYSECARSKYRDKWDREANNNVIGSPWRVAAGKWTVDRPASQIDPLPPPPVPFEGARVQRERITRTDIEAFGTTAGRLGCDAIRSGRRAQARSDSCRVRLRSVPKQLQQDLSAWNPRREVLHGAIATETRNVRRREEVGSTAGELAAPQEWKDVPIPPSHPRKRRAMKAATADASSGSSQMEGSLAVAEMPTPQNSSTDESRMDVEREERDGPQPCTVVAKINNISWCRTSRTPNQRLHLHSLHRAGPR